MSYARYDEVCAYAVQICLCVRGCCLYFCASDVVRFVFPSFFLCF